MQGSETALGSAFSLPAPSAASQPDDGNMSVMFEDITIPPE